MDTRPLGALGPVSVLTLGGGGLGQIWGETSRKEAVATARAAVDAGITLLDVAPGYGRGEAERVIGEAFAGRLPEGVRIGTKVMVGDPGPGAVADRIEHSLSRSLEALRLDRVDCCFLHSNLVPDGYVLARHPEVQHRLATPWTRYVDEVRPAFERLVAEGRIGAWGITGVALPRTVLDALADAPAPAAVQCIANLLDSAGSIYVHDEPPRHREVIAAAAGRGIGVLGIRAVQAGALTDSVDRQLADDEPEMADYRRAAAFRTLATEVGDSPAALAHRYALAMDSVDTVVLGVKNRVELAECVAAAARGPLDAALVARIDEAVGRKGSA
ncbi:MAG: aldo/keto reductase [Actinobacteria bacterium]|nr:aldo/keto reductase [Actinomycetota bacterium]